LEEAGFITAVGFSSLIHAVKLCLLWQPDASAPHSHPSWLFPSRPSMSWPANEMSQISSAHVQRFHVSERTPLGVALECRMRLAHWYLQELFLGYWGWMGQSGQVIAAIYPIHHSNRMRCSLSWPYISHISQRV
jgi:hypothetical protein